MRTRLVELEEEILRLQRALGLAEHRLRHEPLRYRLVDQLNGALKLAPPLHRLGKTIFSKIVSMGNGLRPARVAPPSSSTNGPLPPRTWSVEPGASAERGVNLFGFLTSEKGIGEIARSLLRSMEAVQIAYSAVSLQDVTTPGLDRQVCGLSRRHPYSVNIMSMNPPELALLAEVGVPLIGRFNIGYWNWELPTLPDTWVPALEQFNEIWVASHFVQDTVSRVSPIPVVRVPPCVSMAPDNVAASQGILDTEKLSADTFIFFFCFDYLSSFERKNPVGLVQAFRKAFGDSEDVCLVVKSAHPYAAPDSHRRLAAHAEAKNIVMLDGNLDRRLLTCLFSRADCYVSLHRAEGFGLSLAEAMLLGKPVIATGYSGNLDYMTVYNSFLVRYSLTEIVRDEGPYLRGGVWAEPDLEHAAELMRYVYENRERSRQTGARGQGDVRRYLAPEAVGQRIRQRLQCVWKKQPIDSKRLTVRGEK